jgi:hypothetical protein
MISKSHPFTTYHFELTAQWTRIGVGFNQQPAEKSPDLERLLLATSRVAASDPRLFTMAATWLSKYSDLIAKHRLNKLITLELEQEHRPILGLLLDIVKNMTGTDHFNGAIERCEPASTPRPLFEIERTNDSFKRLAERRASAVSRRWNLWTAELEPKYDALRSPSWVITMNPEYRERAALKGDLRASILEELKQNPASGDSESQLARQTGANRTAVRDALENLDLMSRIDRQSSGNRCRIVLRSEPSHAA